jgi:hypothetical protein
VAAAPPEEEPEPTPEEPAEPAEAAQDPPEANPGSNTIPPLEVGSQARTDGQVSLRTEASTESDRIVVLDGGTTVTILSEQVADATGIADSPEWYQVETEDGTTGYIREDLLVPVE